MSYRELLIGCWHSRERRVRAEQCELLHGPAGKRFPARAPDGWANLTTLDANIDCAPDLVCSLDAPRWGSTWKPHRTLADLFEPKHAGPGAVFRDSIFDEIHAYEVLEHLGRQGDAFSFFATFNELWRLLKPEGLLCATTPALDSRWRWADPGHTRLIVPESLVFLDRRQAKMNILRGVSSDYRSICKCDFAVIRATEREGSHTFVLEAIKPERPW